MKKIRDNRTIIIFAIGIISFALAIYFVFLDSCRLKIEVSPKNAQILLDNRPLTVNNSGISKTSVASGTYTLKVEANGYVSYKTEIKAEKGRSISKKVDLKKLPELTLLDEGSYLANYFNDQILYLGDNRRSILSLTAELNDKNLVVSSAKKPLTPEALSNIDKIIFSPDHQLAILKTSHEASLYDFNRYDIIHQEIRKYSDYVGDIIWSPDQSRLAYYYAPPTGERSLIFANTLNENQQRVVDLTTMEDPILHWSKNSDKILIIPRNSDTATNQIYLLDVYTKALQSLTDFGGVLDAKFIQNDQQIVYFTSTNDPKSPIKSEVSVMDADGNNKKSLEIKSYPEQTYFQSDEKVIFTTYSSGQEKLINIDFKAQKTNTIYFKRPQNFKIQNVYLSNDSKMIFLVANNNLYGAEYTDDNYGE